MIIGADVQVAAWAPIARFVRVKKPAYVLCHFPWEPSSPDATGLVSDYGLQMIGPAPLRVPHNLDLYPDASGYASERSKALAAGGYDTSLPTIDFKVTTATGIAQILPIWGGQSTRSLGIFFGAGSFSDAGASTLVTECAEPISCHGFSLTVQARPRPARILADGPLGGSSAPALAPKVWAGVAIGNDDDRLWWRVVSIGNGDYRIERSVDETLDDWDLIETVSRPDSKTPLLETYTDGQAEPTLDVEFRLHSGRLIIRVVDLGRTLTYAEDRRDSGGSLIARINSAAAGSAAFSGLSLWAEPLKWHRNGTFRSPEISVGFAPGALAGLTTIAVPGSAGSYTVTLDEPESTLDQPTISFVLDTQGPLGGTYRGTEYSNLWAGWRAFYLAWTSETASNPDAPASLAPDTVSVRHRFNPASLQINSAVSLEFPANRPVVLPGGAIDTWGAWSQARGQIALEIALLSTVHGSGTVFTGYGHNVGDTVGQEGGVRFTMSGVDRSAQLQSPRWDLPWMDGWNVYYAIAYLAQLGGVDRSDMTFESLIPLEPIGPGADLGDGEGGPAYFLPYGSGGSVLTRFSGIGLWQAMSKIAQSIGFMLFFGADGRLQFRRFRLPVGTKRTYYESDPEGGGSGGCWSIQVRKDLGEVRSPTILVGIDAFAPLWDPILERREDVGVTDDPLADNHLGYSNPTVWVDAQFAAPGFAEEAADGIHITARTPGLDARLTTWLQPDIFPLDVVAVYAPRFGLFNERLMVIDVAHQVTRSIGTSTITARRVPE